LGKLIMWNLITLDGCFEGPKSWDLDFHNHAWGPELEQFSLDQGRDADGLVFGRVTYEGMAGYWSTAEGEVAEFMNRLPKYVFSRTLERADWNNSTLLKGDLVNEITRIKAAARKSLYLFGSGNLSASLMRHNLFDEYRIGLVPVVLGKGRPLFGAAASGPKLKLIDTRALQTGCVILRYEPERG
jgi:dihydrofolate reductase